MISYDDLLMMAEKEGIAVEEQSFHSSRIKGLYADNVIAINSCLETSAEKVCVLAEELGHHCTSCGEIIDQSRVTNRKQEKKARVWAYEKLIGPERLIVAFENGIQSRFELAEFLNVTENLIQDAIDYFKTKYWPYYSSEDYYIFFDPLIIIKKFE